MPRRMLVWPTASHTRTPEGTGITAAPRPLPDNSLLVSVRKKSKSILGIMVYPFDAVRRCVRKYLTLFDAKGLSGAIERGARHDNRGGRDTVC
jgi:hypothetical protein